MNEGQYHAHIGVYMRKDLKISVVVPVYNVEKYLFRCIDSIKKQSYKNWEAILVDDGSTDNSGNICDMIAANDERFHTYHKNNEGLGLTRNYGVKHSDGEYIFFLDSDDYIEETALSDLMQHVDQDDCDLVIGNFYYQDKIMEIPIESKIYEGKEVNDCIVMRIIGNAPGRADQLTPSSCGKLYKRRIFNINEIWFPSERVLIWEDLAFNYKFMRCCKKVYLTDIPVYHYCYNGDSLTHKYDPEKLHKVMKMYRYMRNQIEMTQTNPEFIERLNNNFIGHIRTCFKLEAFYDKKNGYFKTLHKIKSMCRNEDVQRIIADYDTKYYNQAQNIFSKLIKKQNSFLIYVMCKAQNAKKRIE